jgi:hypothetical protein
VTSPAVTPPAGRRPGESEYHGGAERPAGEELRRAVARLVDPRRIRIVRDPVVDSAYAADQPAGATTRHTELPSLLDQLAGAVNGDRAGGAAGAGAGRRPPGDLDAMTLQSDLDAAARRHAAAGGVRATGRTTAGVLRALAVAFWPDGRALAAAADDLARLVARIETSLARRLGEEGRVELRGVRCPSCLTREIWDAQPGEPAQRRFPLVHDRRPPAQGGGFRGIRCESCRHEWTGRQGVVELAQSVATSDPLTPLDLPVMIADLPDRDDDPSPDRSDDE